MRKKLVCAPIIAAIFIVSIFANGAFAPNVVGDLNLASAVKAESPQSAVIPAFTLAFVRIYGPASSYDIKVYITNQAGSRIRFISLSCIFCKTGTGARLLIDNAGVFSISAPPGGTVTVYTPTSTKNNPEVTMEFTGFDSGETTIFNLDPDTFGDDSYGATVGQMKGLLVQVWLENGYTSGYAKCKLHSSGAVYAFVSNNA